MSGAPIFTVVNEAGTQRVVLVDDNGVGNAIPTVQNFLDLDIRHDYTTGDQGLTPVRLPHEFTLSMDYVTQDVREKLLYLKHQRDRVTLADPTVSPEGSVFGWRPAPITNLSQGSQTAYDLTGTYAVQCLGDSNKFAYWNPDTHEMIGPLVSRQSPLLKTVHGLAYAAGRKTTNRVSNPYPESATDGHGSGLSGWKLSDASGIASKTHITDGFDCSICPDTLRIQTDGSSGIIKLDQTDYFTPTHGDYGGWIPPSNSTCWGSVWVKGTFPSFAFIEHGPDGNKGNYDISGQDFSQWTRIDVGEQNTTWGEYNFSINAVCAAGTVADFEVGPTMVCIEDSTQSHGGPGNFTEETNHTAAQGYEVIRMTGLSFPCPLAGTATVWFSVPTGSDVFREDKYREIRTALFNLPRSGGGSWDGNVWLTQYDGSPTTFRIQAFTLNSSSTYWELPSGSLGAGIHSCTITWGSFGLNCYFDGKQLASELGGMFGMNPGTGTVTFAGGIDSDWEGGSLLFHGFSVQAKEFDSANAPHVGAGVSDTVSRSLCDTTKGRLYEIISVPSIPLIQDGFTRWMGDIRFRQVNYDADYAAWFAEEL